MKWIFASLLCFASFVGCAQTLPLHVLLLGDSLSAGYGIARERAWPSLLAQRLADHNPPYRLINASTSGETTAGGKSRLPALLERHRPHLVVLALGANDGLRGLPIEHIRENLRAMIRMSRKEKATILLIGMKLPPNYGPAYAESFSALFQALAREENVPLLPFLLEPIALDDTAFQADRLHPTEKAQPLIFAHVWQALQPLLNVPKGAARQP
ncbi:MAG: arylesterase [Rhodocyclaceae bacterium]|nr:arylesterase [Rhodocyclaceae bacterium]